LEKHINFIKEKILIALAIIITQLLRHRCRTPQASPKGNNKSVVGLTDVEVVYSRPSARGRAFFGNWFFGKLWRTGANENTTFLLVMM
jgi:hypothetical protein